MPVTVRIPTPLRAVTKGNAEVQATGDTVDDIIDDLERQFPGTARAPGRRERRAPPLHQHLREPGGHPVPREPATTCSRTATRSRSCPPSPEAADAAAVPVPHLPARPGLHRVGHPRDDARGEPVRRRQPRPGHAELPAARRRSSTRRIAALDGDFHQYAITWGAPRLRRRHRRQVPARSTAWTVDPERHVTVCCGSTETMLATLLAVLNPGDEVIIFEPFYENYGPGLHHLGRGADLGAAGAAGLLVRSRPPGAGRSRRARGPSSSTAPTIRRARSSRGRSCRRSPTCACEHDLLAITDEIYEHIVYDGLGHTPIATLPGHGRAHDHDLRDVEVVLGHGLAGRLGGGAAEDISVGIRRAHDFVTVGAPHPLQEAAVDRAGAAATRTTSSCARATRPGATCCSATSSARGSWRGSRAARTTSSPTPPTSCKRCGLADDTAFAMWLIKEVGVATVPGSSFYAHPELGRTKIRFCFPKTDDVLRGRRGAPAEAPHACRLTRARRPRAIWRAALAAGDVAPLLRRHLRLDGARARAPALATSTSTRVRRVLVLGAGKAGGVDGARGGGDARRPRQRGLRRGEGRLPVADARGSRSPRPATRCPTPAASRPPRGCWRWPAAAAADDLVLVPVSGGGSALRRRPAPPITLEEKQARDAAAAGGRRDHQRAERRPQAPLALQGRAAGPGRRGRPRCSRWRCPTSSAIRSTSSPPARPRPTRRRFADALAVLRASRRHRARRRPSVLERLRAGARGEVAETPKPGDRVFERVTNLVIGNNALVVDAAAAEAERARLPRPTC